ncbi:hypothetical protein Pan97_50520 [Bremerella volcania]|uniref:Carboxypeptidase regulatory-like domain-containing protein n=1 Tax=Bremerella volcania TaxID=2527984 RepID=A0A518CFG3_9BACT|nr:DUF4198 domain-containing protein [Bremerella volcania]QDU77973.1 hypothetical protein Pan97_50520 [Bremerella volcania]
MKLTQNLGTVALVALVVLLAGCSQENENFAPVSGTVTVKGKPQPNLIVSFLPVTQGEEPAIASSGLTDDQGRFTLKTTGEDGMEGAMIGQHQVRIRNRIVLGAEDAVVPEKSSAVRLPSKATDGSLTVDVPKEGLDTLTFEL